MSIRQIRKLLVSQFGPRRYRITRDGEIHVFGPLPHTRYRAWYLYGYLDSPETLAALASNAK